MKRKTKKVLLVVAIIFIILFVAVKIMQSSIEKNLEELANAQIAPVQLEQLAAGKYIGNFEQFPLAVEVAVTISQHEITAIDIVEHKNGKGKAAEAIIDDVIAAQSLDVDTVSGATYSSKAILKAIENALHNQPQS